MSKVHGAQCDQCTRHCVPGDGLTWITLEDGPIKVTCYVKNERRSNISYGRLDFCSIDCLVAYVAALQAEIPPATHNVDVIRHQSVLNEPISKFTGDDAHGKEET